MLILLNGINEVSYLLEVDSFWIILILALLLLLGIIKCLYPWQPKWKTEVTEDKSGKKVIKHYYLSE